MTRWQRDLEGRGWNSQYLSNHDQPRQVSRFGDDGRYRVESAKMLATLLHLLQGTPYIYQGEELGMTNVAFASIEDYRDVATRNAYRELVEERGMDRDEVMERVHRKSRDNARTPMQWDASANAGFTSGDALDQGQPQLSGDQRGAGGRRSGLRLSLLPATDPPAQRRAGRRRGPLRPHPRRRPVDLRLHPDARATTGCS